MKTFVAPIVGGPLDGKLYRTSIVDERLMVPNMTGQGMLYFQYVLVVAADGSRSWRPEKVNS